MPKQVPLVRRHGGAEYCTAKKRCTRNTNNTIHTIICLPSKVSLKIPLVARNLCAKLHQRGKTPGFLKGRPPRAFSQDLTHSVINLQMSWFRAFTWTVASRSARDSRFCFLRSVLFDGDSLGECGAACCGPRSASRSRPDSLAYGFE